MATNRDPWPGGLLAGFLATAAVLSGCSGLQGDGNGSPSPFPTGAYVGHWENTLGGLQYYFSQGGQFVFFPADNPDDRATGSYVVTREDTKTRYVLMVLSGNGADGDATLEWLFAPDGRSAQVRFTERDTAHTDSWDLTFVDDRQWP